MVQISCHYRFIVARCGVVDVLSGISRRRGRRTRRIGVIQCRATLEDEAVSHAADLTGWQCKGDMLAPRNARRRENRDWIEKISLWVGMLGISSVCPVVLRHLRSMLSQSMAPIALLIDNQPKKKKKKK